MPKPFDNITRHLLSFDTPSWARFIGIETTQAELCNADLSTVTSQADAVVLLGAEKRKAAHVEIQASYDSKIGERLNLYNALAWRALDVPVASYVVLLRPEADGPAMTGVLRQVGDEGVLIREFHYRAIRVWEIPAEDIFHGGLGILPLAFIGKIDPGELPALMSVRFDVDRIARELNALFLRNFTDCH